MSTSNLSNQGPQQEDRGSDWSGLADNLPPVLAEQSEIFFGRKYRVAGSADYDLIVKLLENGREDDVLAKSTSPESQGDPIPLGVYFKGYYEITEEGIAGETTEREPMTIRIGANDSLHGVQYRIDHGGNRGSWQDDAALLFVIA